MIYDWVKIFKAVRKMFKLHKVIVVDNRVRKKSIKKSLDRAREK